MSDFLYQLQDEEGGGEDGQQAKKKLSEATAAARLVSKERLHRKYGEMRTLSSLAKPRGNMSKLHILEAGVAQMELQQQVVQCLTTRLEQAGIPIPELPSIADTEDQIFTPGGPHLSAVGGLRQRGRRRRGGRGGPQLGRSVQLVPPGVHVDRPPIRMIDIHGTYADRHPEFLQEARDWGGGRQPGFSHEASDRGGGVSRRESLPAAQGRAEEHQSEPVIQVMGGEHLLPSRIQEGGQPERLRIISVQGGYSPHQDFRHGARDWDRDQHPECSQRAEDWGGRACRKESLPAAQGHSGGSSDPDVEIVWQGVKDLSSGQLAGQQHQRPSFRTPTAKTYRRSRDWRSDSSSDERSPWEKRTDRIHIFSSTLERVGKQSMETTVVRPSISATTMNPTSSQDTVPLDLSSTESRLRNLATINKPKIWSPAREIMSKLDSLRPEEVQRPGHVLETPAPFKVAQWVEHMRILVPNW